MVPIMAAREACPIVLIVPMRSVVSDITRYDFRYTNAIKETDGFPTTQVDLTIAFLTISMV